MPFAARSAGARPSRFLFLSLVLAVAAAACAPEVQEQPPPAPPPAVSIAGGHALVAGKSLTLVAVTRNGSDASYTWSSADPAVADVDAAGTVRGWRAGEVLITATGDDTKVSGVTAIVVEPAPVANVEVAGQHRVQLGQTTQLVAITVNGADQHYFWSSDDETVATVSGGVVTGVDVGDTVITATGAQTGAVGSFVVSVIGSSAVTVTGPYYLAVNSDGQLHASTVNGVDPAYTWASSDDTVATVDGTGKVHAIKAGDVVVMATGTATGLSGTLGLVVQQTIPHFDEWASSGHADHTAEPFNHWNSEGQVPTTCARCHTEQGYRDYLGDDGSAAGVVDQPAPTGGVLVCTTCHNDTASSLAEVTFPSGKTITGLGAEARCMVCHQGRASGQTVDAAIATAGVGDEGRL